MSSIKAHLGMILLETQALSREHLTETDEFIVLNRIETTVHEARQVFERTKKIDDEKPSVIQEVKADSP